MATPAITPTIAALATIRRILLIPFLPSFDPSTVTFRSVLRSRAYARFVDHEGARVRVHRRRHPQGDRGQVLAVAERKFV